eukprot:364922-Chlamydomonas_euryale.AAC.6
MPNPGLNLRLAQSQCVRQQHAVCTCVRGCQAPAGIQCMVHLPATLCEQTYCATVANLYVKYTMHHTTAAPAIMGPSTTAWVAILPLGSANAQIVRSQRQP